MKVGFRKTTVYIRDPQWPDPFQAQAVGRFAYVLRPQFDGACPPSPGEGHLRPDYWHILRKPTDNECDYSNSHHDEPGIPKDR
jgi:hypothetical protein